MRIAKFLIVSFTAFILIIGIPWKAQAVVNDANADLSSIHEGAGSLSPAFSPSITEYWVKMRSSEAGFYTAATTANSDATMEYSMNGGSWVGVAYYASTGYLSTNRGDNTFQLRVTATNTTTTKTYTIHVYFPDTNDADLTDLRSNETTLNPNFQSNITKYTADVSYATSSISITGVLNDAAASVKINDSNAANGATSGSIPLNVGSNIITVQTKSYNTNVNKTYTVTVTRAANTNADLSALAVSGSTISPVFQSNQTAYTLPDVSNETDTLMVTPTLSDPTGAFVHIKVNDGSYTPVTSGYGLSMPLAVGSNTITLEVLSQDTSISKQYTIKVIRKNNDATLSGLAVTPGNLNEPFASSTFFYTMANVPYPTSSLAITPTLSDPTGAAVYVRINGGSDTQASSGYPVSVPLIVGSNTVEIKVVMQDTAAAKIYTLSVERLKNSDASLSSLSVSTGNLAFSPEVTDYTLTVSQSIYELTVKPVSSAGNNAATIQVRINGGSYSTVQSGMDSLRLQLASGLPNVIDIHVTAQDGTSLQYTIKVILPGTPALNDLVLEEMQAKLTFSEPLLRASSDPTYYTIKNVSRNSDLSVAQVVYTQGSSEVKLNVSGQLLPGDEVKFDIKAGAVVSLIGEGNAAAGRTIVYGNPLQQLKQRLVDLDVEHDGIHINEIITYMTAAFGQHDLNGDGQFNREDVVIILSQIGTKVIP
ncbi:cadherin-like beta sandwich domain-containing protein [Paenibacillus sp. FSL H8-0034]|uniref:cadherin-like beta sandwich domain-containing protein n=1 Tax=Paenibacillus sp. FSL H8-0034 TaxID=2954671 RepID=UPI0030F59124